jgi:hypothetical protein
MESDPDLANVTHVFVDEARTHAQTHACTRTHRHTHTHARERTCTNAHVRTYAQTRTRTHRHACTDARTRTRARRGHARSVKPPMCKWNHCGAHAPFTRSAHKSHARDWLPMRFACRRKGARAIRRERLPAAAAPRPRAHEATAAARADERDDRHEPLHAVRPRDHGLGHGAMGSGAAVPPHPPLATTHRGTAARLSRLTAYASRGRPERSAAQRSGMSLSSVQPVRRRRIGCCM